MRIALTSRLGADNSGVGLKIQPGCPQALRMLPPDPCPNQDGDILKRARYIFKRTITLSLGVLREPSVCVCVSVCLCAVYV